MKFRLGTKLLSCFLLILASSLAFADTVTVGCPGGTPGTFSSLETAVVSSPDHTTFLVSGTCSEIVSIQKRNDLNFFGNPSATIQAADPSLPVVNISSSQGISFNSGFTFTGGIGLQISLSPSVRLSGITVQNSTVFGITSADSAVHLSRSSVTASTRSGIVVIGGAFYLDGGVNVSNNGRLGISVDSSHLSIQDGLGPNIVSNNGISGIQVFGSSQGDFNGDNEFTTNGGQFGLLVLNNSGVSMTNGIINSNTGLGVFCGGTTHCEFSGTHIDSNGAGGIQIVDHSDAAFDGAVEVSGNTGVGVLVDQNSYLNSAGGNTITNNTGDGLILNALSALKFTANDTITATTGNLALNCNNGSLVTGDVTPYKPRKCGPAFQAVPIH